MDKDILKLLSESQALECDIVSVMESVFPTPNFMNNSGRALACEVENFVNEAYVDYKLYTAETEQLMLESVRSLDEHALNVMQDAINEGIGQKASAVVTRIIQAIKGLIRKLQVAITSHSVNSAFKGLTDISGDAANKLYNEAVASGTLIVALSGIDINEITEENKQSKLDEIDKAVKTYSERKLDKVAGTVYANKIKADFSKMLDEIKRLIKKMNELAKKIQQDAFAKEDNTKAIEDARASLQVVNRIVAEDLKVFSAVIKAASAARKATKKDAPKAEDEKVATTQKEEKPEEEEIETLSGGTVIDKDGNKVK